VAKLPPVSTTLAKLVEKFAAGVVATGVVDASGAPWLANISEIRKFGLNGILRGWGGN
jgi:hypothetical protein